MKTLTPTEAKPFLRWVGGKKNFVPQLAPQILSYLEKTGGRYIEPFLGGGAMALHLGLPSMILNDVLPELATTYCVVRDVPEEMATTLYELSQWGTSESHYYAVRETMPDTLVDIAVRMIYLNAHSFNGIWRVNQKGEMNVPYGKKEERITDSLIERIGAASRALAGAEIYQGDFDPVIALAGEGDLLYVDPPYDGTWDGYSSQGFDGIGQNRLASALHEASKRGAAFITHNSDTEHVRWWYKSSTLLQTAESRSVNSDGEGRSKARCLLITNRPELLLQAAVAA